MKDAQLLLFIPKYIFVICFLFFWRTNGDREIGEANIAFESCKICVDVFSLKNFIDTSVICLLMNASTKATNSTIKIIDVLQGELRFCREGSTQFTDDTKQFVKYYRSIGDQSKCCFDCVDVRYIVRWLVICFYLLLTLLDFFSHRFILFFFCVISIHWSLAIVVVVRSVQTWIIKWSILCWIEFHLDQNHVIGWDRTSNLCDMKRI